MLQNYALKNAYAEEKTFASARLFGKFCFKFNKKTEEI